MEAVQIIFYYFIFQIPINQVSRQLKATEKAIGKLYSKMRGIVSLYIEDLKIGRSLGVSTMDDNGNQTIGIVEIDETLVTHHNGDQMWVFGIFDRRTKELWCWPVEDRTAETLIPLIVSSVEPGARIYSDGWASYSSLAQYGFEHQVVLHVNGFGSGENTTNGIESCWSELKRLMKHSQGIQVNSNDPIGSLREHVNLGIWRRSVQHEDAVESLVSIINTYYA